MQLDVAFCCSPHWHHNRVMTNAALPIRTPESLAMSKALKKAGFKFVGPTTCYSLMQVHLLTIRWLH